MKQSHKLVSKFVSKLVNLILTALTLSTLAFVPAAAATPQNAALPLPDVTFYGTATKNGEVLEGGKVQAILPRGGRVSAAIAPIAGTDYNYALAVPLNAFDDPATAALPADAVVADDTLYFMLDGVKAFYKDANDLVVRSFTIPSNAMGQTYILDLMLANADNYVMGDVNVNGKRDVADALLMMRYGVGFVAGTEDFPPALGKIYLPLCDVVVDDSCNNNDALRILQCDAGVPGVLCLTAPPADAFTPTLDAPLVFRLSVAPAPEGAITRTVHVMADDVEGNLGAASLEVRYDATQLALEGCVVDPLAALDAGVCYAAPGSGRARLNAVAIDGAGPGAVLADLSFAPVGNHSLTTLEEELDWQVNGAFDLDGQVLAWSHPSAPGPLTQSVFLPLVMRDSP